MEDDASLVQRTVGGDSAAFGELYDRYAGIVRAVCFDTAHDLNTAQDLAQEVFIRAFSKLSHLRQRDRFGPWLVAISRYVCQEWCRSRKRDRHRFMSDPPEANTKTDTNSLDVLSELRLAELRLAIARLPEQERLALHLFYLQQHPVDVARGVLGLSNSAFYKIVARARERLAKLLSQASEFIP